MATALNAQQEAQVPWSLTGETIPLASQLTVKEIIGT